MVSNQTLRIILLSICISLGLNVNARIFVDIAATGANNGTSWANAFSDLQDGLDAAIVGEEVWVAQGTYLPLQEPDGAPSGTADDEYKAFHLDNKDIQLYGGFVGNETLLFQRNWRLNKTILSGDVFGNDMITGAGNSLNIAFNNENRLHVFVTVGLSSAGRIDGFSIEGGRAIGYGDITFAGVTIEDGSGAGIYNVNSSPEIRNLIFSGNSITPPTSGGGSLPTGAGMRNINSSPTISSVIFALNESSGYGASMANMNLSSPLVSNVLFVGNNSSRGAGIYNNNSTPIVINSSFTNNRSTQGGAGIFNNSNSVLTISNSLFYNNDDGSSNNVDIVNNNSSSTSVSYSALEEYNLFGTTACFYLTANPFVNDADLDGIDNLWMTSDDGLGLVPGSPCVGAGTAVGAPTADIAGSTRLNPPSIGAYEGLPSPCQAATRLYVNINAGGLNDGTSWANGFLDLQPALDCADDGDTIWVAHGTYLPTEEPDGAPSGVGFERYKAFHLANKDIVIYGGFLGNETLASQRDWIANPTILSGDFNNDDIVTGGGATLTFANYTENALNVFITVGLSTDSELDGFSIISGNANTSGNYTYESELIQLNAGGGMQNKANSSPNLSNILFLENFSNSAGGGFYCSSSSSSLNEITFSKNQSNFGGGMFTNSGSANTLNNVIFIENKATTNGGGLDISSSAADLTNVSFIDNQSDVQGGGMLNFNALASNYSNVVFHGNEATLRGGGMYNSNTSPNLINVTFSENSANEGGAIYNTSAAFSSTYTNTLFYGNISPNQKDIFENSATIVVEYCAFEDYVFGAALGCLYLTASPFVNAANPDGGDNIWMTADDGLVLAAGSPPVGTGTATGAPVTDITGTTRPSPPSIGAYEGLPAPCQAATRLYVNINAGGLNDGTSWANGFFDLQPALDCADDGDTIWVAHGTYLPTEEPDGAPNVAARYRSFHIANKDVVIYGGFIGNETLASQRDWQANPVILSGDFLGDDIVTGAGSSLSIANNTENAYHVFVMVGLNTVAELDGFRIIGGNANNGSISFDYGSVGATIFADEGGGLNNSFNSSPTLSNLIITHNNAASNGGGMYNNSSSSPVINNATFAENISANGGGMYNLALSQVVLTNVVFSGNRALAAGGMRNQGSSPILTNVTFSANHGLNSGGAIRNTGSSPVLTNILFYGNTSNNQKDIFNNSATPVVSYSAFEDYVFGAAVGCITLTASPFTNVLDPDGADDIFMTVDDGLSLITGSPPVVAGTASGAPTQDIAGTTRPNPPSIGAYEGDACLPTTGTDTQTACDSLTWTNGITYTASNITALDTFVNAGGCDSVVTLNLTINTSNTGTDTQIACDSLTWIDGNTYMSSTNTPTFMTRNGYPNSL